MIVPRAYRASYVALLLAASSAGCTQSTGNPITPIVGSGTATPAATPSATVTATAKPTAAPTATPTAVATSIAVSGGLGSFDACALLGNDPSNTVPVVAIPGNYALFETIGNVVNSTYTQSEGIWLAFSISAPPSASPTPVATVTPVPTGTMVSYNVYLGNYTIPSFTITPNPSASPSPGATPAVVDKTVGCVVLIDSLNGAPIVSEPNASPTPVSANAVSLGIPNIGDGFNLFDDSGIVGLGEGYVTSFSIPNLGTSGGTGSFALDAGVTGTVMYGAPQVYTESQVRRLRARLARLRSLAEPARR